MEMSVLEAVLQTLNSLKLDGSNASRSTPVDQENLETAEKLRIFHSLPMIAASLGPTDTKEKLVPVLEDVVSSAIKAGDDEVLLAIAKQLCGFGELLGGKEQAACLLPILEEIVYRVEEIVVVQAACDALVELIPKLPPDIINDKCAKMIKRIIEDDSYCASRKVMTQLITTCYPFLNEKLQSDFKYRIFHLADSDEEVPLVRAAAVAQLVQLSKLVGPAIKAELALILSSLVSDNQRVVRAACVAPLIQLGRLITDPAEFDSTVAPCIDKLANDSTRDTRRAMASSIVELQQIACSFPSPAAAGGNSRSLHPMMLTLLEDNEIETRRIAATQLKDFCQASPKEVLTTVLLPQLREHLWQEREEPVRAELVRCAVALMPSMRREDALPLVQLIMAFLNDTNSQSKQYVFEHFAELVSLMPASEVQLTLVPSLLRLWQDKNWRVRLGVVQSVPCLFSSLPESCVREAVLPANLAWLRDPAWYVRECACRSLARLLRQFPALCKDALQGQSGNSTAPSAATTTTTASTTSPASPAPPTTTATTEANASTVVQLLNSVTSQAAAGGLKALATDANYHFRQMFINAVQTIWGPGIPDEPAYSATGDVPGMGVCVPRLAPTPCTPGTVPPGCQPPPQVPAQYQATCLTQLLRLAAEDPVPNVRLCAVQALRAISSGLDKKLIQKDVVPALRKITENDADADVRFYAQEGLGVFGAN